ncbi:unnamed protein product, partial [Staurois parvus]
MCAVCCFTKCALLVLPVSTLLCRAVLCTALQSSVQELTGERTALFTKSSPPPEMQN